MSAGEIAGAAYDGARDHTAYDGARDHTAYDGARDHTAYDGARDHTAYDGARDHLPPAEAARLIEHPTRHRRSAG